MSSVDPRSRHRIAIAAVILLVTSVTALPALAGTCGVLPFAAEGGVDQGAADNIASLISSELDIVGDFEFVLSADAKEITDGCGKNAKCRTAFGEGEGHSHVVAGSVGPAGADEYTITATLYEVSGGGQVRQIQGTVGRKPDLLLDAIPLLATELATGKKKEKPAEEKSAATTFDEPAFDDEEDDEPASKKADWQERDRHGRRVRADDEFEEDDLFGDIDEELNLDELDEDKQRKKQAERREREAKEAAKKAEEARLARIAQEERRRREDEERRAEEDQRRREREEERARQDRKRREEERRIAEARQAEEDARQAKEERRRREEEREAAAERRREEEREARAEEKRRDQERRAAEERRREREEREAEEARERDERRAADDRRREREEAEEAEREERRAASDREERRAAADREERRAASDRQDRRRRAEEDERRREEEALLASREEDEEPRLSSALESDEDDGFVIEDEDPGFVIEDEEDDYEDEVEVEEEDDEGAVLIAHEDDEPASRSRRRPRRRDYNDAYSRAREFSDRDKGDDAQSDERSYDRDDEDRDHDDRRSDEDGDFDGPDREDDRDADRLAYHGEGYPEKGSRDRKYDDLDEDEGRAVRARPSRDRRDTEDYSDVSSRYDDRDEVSARSTARATAPSDRQYINIRGHFGYTNYYLHFAEYGLDLGVLVHEQVSIDAGIDFLSVGLTETDEATNQDVQRVHTLPTFTVGGSWHGQFHKIVKPWAGAEFSSTLYAVVRVGGPEGPREPRGSAGFNIKGGVDFMFLRFLGVHVGVKGGLAYSPDIETTVSADWRPLAGVFNATVGATLQF